MVGIRIFVEGKDDEKFVVKLLSHLREQGVIKIEKRFNFGSTTQIMGGKSKMLNFEENAYQKTSAEIDTGIVRKVLFLIDSDFEKDDTACNGLKNTNRCLDTLLDKLGWDIPTERYVFHRNLDHFVLDSIDDKDCHGDFISLVKCLDIESLAPNKKPIASLYRDLYPHPHYDFSHPNFDELKKILIKLFEGTL